MRVKNLFLIAVGILMLSTASAVAKKLPKEVTMSKEVLKDKIKGGWAGKTIGCSYGGPTEFKFAGFINDEVEIPWNDHMIKWWFDRFPGLYDDVYMDLTFVEVFQKEGLDAPIESFAKAFANAPYPLWHANQLGRYNILNGVMPPESGHWHNNPHADDIDFQIEADYAGLMSPGMVNASSFYCDEIGHMMNYGDGWYGGVYVAAMFSLAFVSDDMNFVVNEALKAIPEQSNYYRAMSDVIKWHRQYPKDWHITWALFNERYGYDIGCPDGVDRQFNIDAVINSGYILIGLLYGEKNFYRTIDISTRCGQDSDCNPSSAAGILGTMIGYSNIPEYWRRPCEEVEDIPFVYTDISINKATEYSFSQALQVIGRNGGSTDGDNVTIKVQKPESVRYEKSFEGHYPQTRVEVKKTVTNVGQIRFNGNGIVVKSHYYKGSGYDDSTGYVGEVEIYLDGKLSAVAKNPIKGNGAAPDLYWKYGLPEGEHTLTFKFLNKQDNMNIVIDNYLVYSGKRKVVSHVDE